MNTKKRSRLRSFFGFDPIEKQHKVLTMTVTFERAKAHQVLTLGGDGNLTWRMTNCSIHHSAPGPDCICLNVCFEVGSDMYRFVKLMEKVLHRRVNMLNYNVQLVSLRMQRDNYLIETSTSFEICILQDSQKHVWSRHIYKLPPTWKGYSCRGVLSLCCSVHTFLNHVEDVKLFNLF
ncbi:hypothetical protein N665_0719s0003 [Sinapis alba]|nr:hypothetical protein N665_0719s0003 [Sinapis alba]